MAKKEEKKLVDCRQCEFSDQEPVNHLLPCRNVNVNEGKFMVGCWLKECRHFKERK